MRWEAQINGQWQETTAADILFWLRFLPGYGAYRTVADLPAKEQEQCTQDFPSVVLVSGSSSGSC